MRFIISYSCGKDSTLALHRMLADGHTPAGLLVMMNQDLNRSWFHGVDPRLLREISKSLAIPLLPCASSGEAYHLGMEQALRDAKAAGAEACVFGDIDIADNAAWCRKRCEAAGIKAIFPLWQEDRSKLTLEFVDSGYTALIKCIRNDMLPKTLLGKPFDREAIRVIHEHGADICGENGEFHTLTVDGPAFRYPVPYEVRETLDFGTVSAVNITCAEHDF